MPDSLKKWDVDQLASQPSTEGSTDPTSDLASRGADMVLVQETDKDLSFSLTHTLHSEGSVSSPCEISRVGTPGTPAELLCWLDAEEYDMYTYGAKFRLYVADGACDYLAYRGYYYFKKQWGVTDINDIPVHTTDTICAGNVGATDNVDIRVCR